MALEDKAVQIRYFVLINLPKYHDLYLLKFTAHYFYCFRKSNKVEYVKCQALFFLKLKGISQNLSSTAVISGNLRLKTGKNDAHA